MQILDVAFLIRKNCWWCQSIEILKVMIIFFRKMEKKWAIHRFDNDEKCPKTKHHVRTSFLFSCVLSNVVRISDSALHQSSMKRLHENPSFLIEEFVSKQQAIDLFSNIFLIFLSFYGLKTEKEPYSIWLKNCMIKFA